MAVSRTAVPTVRKLERETRIRGGLVAQEQPLCAVFCTLRICHDPWGTAGHTATTAHHLYWIYNLVYISPI